MPGVRDVAADTFIKEYASHLKRSGTSPSCPLGLMRSPAGMESGGKEVKGRRRKSALRREAGRQRGFSWVPGMDIGPYGGLLRRMASRWALEIVSRSGIRRHSIDRPANGGLRARKNASLTLASASLLQARLRCRPGSTSSRPATGRSSLRTTPTGTTSEPVSLRPPPLLFEL